MSKFYYKLLTKENKIKEGFISAFSKKRAEKTLVRDGSTVIFLLRESSSFLQKDLSFSLSSFSQIEQINFFRNLAAMNSSGLSIIQTLEVLAEQVRSDRVKKAIKAIANDIKNGQRLSVAMAKFPKYFPESLIETVNMGDLSGRLNETLERISIDLEKDYELRKKVLGAMAYPLIIILMMIVVIVTLVFYVLPVIEKLFRELNAPLPLPTKIVLSLSSFVTLHPFMILGALAGIIALFFLILKSKRGHYFTHSLMLKTPIFGKMIKEYNLVLFFRSLESLVMGGISLVQAVEIAKKTLKNDVYKKALDAVCPVLLRGVHLADALKPFPFLFPTQTQKIVEVGEQTGKMEETFSRITDYYERSVDYKTKMMTVLIEPILMIFLAVVVGGLALSVFLPIYQVVNAF